MEDQQHQKFRKMIQRIQNMLDKMDFRPMADHLDMLQHVCREWNQEADRLTHVTREKKGPLGTLFAMGREATIEAVRSFFNGGVSAECSAQIQSKVGVSLRGSNCLKWRTFVEVARILLNDATVTQPECTTAVEAARAICCLARTGSICFDLDVKLIEDHNGNKTRQRNGMKEDTEGRWKKPEITSRFQILHPHLVILSFFRTLIGRFRIKQISVTLALPRWIRGLPPTWSAHVDWPNVSGDESSTIQFHSGDISVALADHDYKDS